MLFLSGSLIRILVCPPFHDAFSQGIEPQKLQKSKKKAVIFFTPVFSSNFIEIKHVKSDDEGIDAVIIIIIIIINLLFDIVVVVAIVSPCFIFEREKKKRKKEYYYHSSFVSSK